MTSPGTLCALVSLQRCSIYAQELRTEHEDPAALLTSLTQLLAGCSSLGMK